MLRSLFLAAAFAGAAASAAAQTLPPEPDTIALSLSAEDWVETKTAKVTARVDATLAGDKAGDARGEALEALAGAAEDAQWRITGFNRSQDASGLERFSITAETRLPEAQLSGLAERAERRSRPGLKARILNVDFTPTRAEREAKLAELRAKIYADVAAELARVNAAYPDRDYRVRDLSVGLTGAPPVPQPRRARAMSADAMMATAEAAFVGGGASVSQKLVVNASVLLAAETPED